MTNRTVLEIVDEMARTGGSVEYLCGGDASLERAVRDHWERFRRVEADVEAMFPPHDREAELSVGRAWVFTDHLPPIPGYVVESLIGRGGVGAVYRARHVALNRTVAIKVLLAGLYAGRLELERFAREARSLASLRHAHVVQVYDVGEFEGRPYLAMEFVGGGSLADRLNGVPVGAEKAASLAVMLTDAVQAAHLAGIVHRDLKPSNVLMSEADVPKISDFGLAVQVSGGEDGPALTRTGARLGTPAYMSPEQASGSSGTIGPAADVYAVGAILYELLTGRPPFVGETPAETERQLIHEQPAPPSRLNPNTPRDLETICLKCLHKDPTRRYLSAQSLGEDLARFQRGEPVEGRRVGLTERGLRWTRKHPAIAVACLSAFVLASVGATLAIRTGLANAAKANAVAQDLTEVEEYERAGRWQQASESLERAKGRFGDGRSPGLMARLARAERELTFVSKFGEIRQNRLVISRRKFDSTRAEGQYRELFEAGDFGAMNDDAAVVGDRVTASPVRQVLLTALDDWAVCTNDPEAQAWLFDVARRADPEPAWRDHVRDASITNSKSVLAALSESADVATQPVSLLVALSERIEQAGGDSTLFLRRVQQEHSGDFYANFRLARVLDRRRNAEALTYYLTSLAAQPRSIAALVELCSVLDDRGEFARAGEYAGRAIRIDPQCSFAYYCLALSSLHLERMKEAIAAARKACELDPSDAQSCGILARALMLDGQFAEGKLAADHCLTLIKPGEENYSIAQSQVRTLDTILKIDARLPAVLKGEETLSPGDKADFAAICILKKNYTDAVRLYAEAFSANAGLIADPHENVQHQAAQAAAHAGMILATGPQDSSVGMEQARLRALTRHWLRGDLEAWTKILAEGKEAERVLIMRLMNGWKKAPEFSDIRDPEAIAALTPEERAECAELWHGVDRLLARADSMGH